MLNKRDLIIFDLDGTIVDSALDFDAMRREMGIEKGRPILEELEKMKNHPEVHKYWSIVERHEMEGASKTTLMPGVESFLKEIRARKYKSAILTRNCTKALEVSLLKIPHQFDVVISRDHDFRPKPFPDGLLSICKMLNHEVSRAVYIGDYLFDLEAAKAANMMSILYAPEVQSFEEHADLVIRHFDELKKTLL